ncbi:MAG: dienelactone hydrolase family protein [Anaerolineales bacterium]
MPEAHSLQHRINSGYIQIITEDGQKIPAFWAHPQHGGPFPGLVLLHDDRGLSPHTRALAHRFAEVGYYVIAPDLFEGQTPQNANQAQALEEYYMPMGPPKVNAAIKALETHHRSNNKIAVLGWDFGGTLVYDVITRYPDIMAGVSFYGDPAPFFGQFAGVQCAVMAIFGDADEILRQHERQLRQEFIRTGQPHEVIVYPDAQHGFYNDNLPEYDAESAEDAWVQTLAFLETHQGKPPPPPDAASGTFRTGRVY